MLRLCTMRYAVRISLVLILSQLSLGTMSSAIVFADDRPRSSHCDVNAPQSLDGRCNNLRFPSLGAVDTPLLYLAGQHYARGLEEALYFMRERPVAPGEVNDFPYFPTEQAAPTTCGPMGYLPECEFTISAEKLNGLGAKTKYNARVLSNALHDINSPLAPVDGQPVLNDAGLTNFFSRFSQVLAHDIQRLEPTVTPRRRRHGLANQSDPDNATVLSGVPVVEPFDQFNVVPVFTPRGVPENPVNRAIIVSGPEPVVQSSKWGRRLNFDNAASVFVDGDTFYGNDPAVLEKIRAREGGKLLITSLTSPRVGVLPPLTMAGFPPSLEETGLREEAAIDGTEPFTPSFADERNLATIGSAVIHVLWLRYHNVQADRCQLSLPEVDPSTPEGDERLFQCARKWTLAVYQRIVFDEFIPAMTGRPLPPYRGYRRFLNPQLSYEALLGPLSLHSTPGELSAIAQPNGMIDERLQVQLPGQPNPLPGYFPFVGSLFPIAEASAAFYFALSGIPTPLGDPSNPATPWRLVEDPLAQQVRGLAYFAHEANDMLVIDSQRNIPANYGFDLVANNTFRNQQFGAANYYQARRRFVRGWRGQIYGRKGCPAHLRYRDDIDDPVTCFQYITNDDEQARLIQQQLLNPLLGVKAKVKHLPLFSGVHMEKTVPGSIVGITGRAIIEQQFRRLRDADRWYYRNQFSIEDIAYVDRQTMATVVRAVIGENAGVQDDLFRLPPEDFFD